MIYRYNASIIKRSKDSLTVHYIGWDKKHDETFEMVGNLYLFESIFFQTTKIWSKNDIIWNWKLQPKKMEFLKNGISHPGG